MYDKASLNDTERRILAKYLAEDNLKIADTLSGDVSANNSFYNLYVKRCIDIVVSLVALGITLPINFVIGIITFFDLGRPIFFKQQRIGRNCEEFELIKFRNMTNETDSSGNLLLPKERVTKWGKVVRKTSLDELLNFWSILKGDMSLIGPRPLVKKYLPRYSKRHRMRHAVRPGLECPMIIPYDESLSRWQNQFENDVWYVEHVSFLVDIKMTFALIKLMFNKKETQGRSMGQRGSFMGYNKEGLAICATDVPDSYFERMYREYGQDITIKTLND